MNTTTEPTALPSPPVSAASVTESQAGTSSLAQRRSDYLNSGRAFVSADPTGELRNATIESCTLGLLGLIEDEQHFSELRSAYLAAVDAEHDNPGALEQLADFVDIIERSVTAIKSQFNLVISGTFAATSALSEASSSGSDR